MSRSYVFSAATFGLLLATTAIAETTPSDVFGTWQTDVGENVAPDGSLAYIRATTIFTEDAQDLIFEIFGDADLNSKLFEYHSSGPWKSQGASADVSGALAVDMTNDVSRVEIFVDAPEIWQALNIGACPLEVGKAVEIKDCVAGPPFTVTDCVDLDIVMVDQEGGRLRFGNGDVDRCETRPTALSEHEFFKTNGSENARETAQLTEDES